MTLHYPFISFHTPHTSHTSELEGSSLVERFSQTCMYICLHYMSICWERMRLRQFWVFISFRCNFALANGLCDLYLFASVKCSCFDLACARSSFGYVSNATHLGHVL